MSGYYHYGHGPDETQAALVTTLHRSAPQPALVPMRAVGRASQETPRVDPS